MDDLADPLHLGKLPYAGGWWDQPDAVRKLLVVILDERAKATAGDRD